MTTCSQPCEEEAVLYSIDAKLSSWEGEVLMGRTVFLKFHKKQSSPVQT